MKMGKKTKIAGAVGAVLLSAYAAIGLRGFDFTHYSIEPICNVTTGLGEVPENCSYSVKKDIKHQGLFGFRNNRFQEVFWDQDNDGLLDHYVVNIVYMSDPKRTLKIKYQSHRMGYIFISPEVLPKGTVFSDPNGNVHRVMTDDEERTIRRKFDDVISHLPAD